MELRPDRPDRRQTVAPATTVYQAQSGGLLGNFLAQYTAPNGGVSDVGVRVLLSSEGEIQSVSIVDASTGSSAGVSLEVGGTLTPYVFVPSSSDYQQVLSTQSIPVTEDLRSTSCGCRRSRSSTWAWWCRTPPATPRPPSRRGGCSERVPAR